MKKLTLAVLALFALLVPMSVHAQQYTLTQTTLSAAAGGNILGQGPGTQPVPAATLVQVTSATGIVGINPNLSTTASQPNQSVIYVDRELMMVTAVNGTTLTVVRGYNGTVAAPHASGAMVLVGKPFTFYTFDPGGTPASGTGIGGAACSAANTLVTPWVNIRTGAQWLCSTITNTWIAGWNNPVATEWSAPNTAVASATTITPSGPLFHITGTTLITTIAVPVGMNATTTGSASFCAIPDAAYTTSNAGNLIKAASTAAIGQVMCFTWNPASQKWAQSY